MNELYTFHIDVMIKPYETPSSVLVKGKHFSRLKPVYTKDRLKTRTSTTTKASTECRVHEPQEEHHHLSPKVKCLTRGGRFPQRRWRRASS